MMKLAVFAFYAACIFVVAEVAQAQNGTSPVTDRAEVSAFVSIFKQWNIISTSGAWNVTVEPCSEAARNSTTIDDNDFSALVKCDCSYDNNATCHITQLKVYAMSIVGVIPEELWTLTYLTDLNLAQNCFTGKLSSSIRKLTRLQYLSLAINALSGELPKELGGLTNLISLSFGSNNFSGSLPSELGNLVNLEQIYFDSSGVSGEIPPSFANLRNLQTVWASDTELTGTIPDFIGNWSKLEDLRFQGNSFQGPIPSTFSNLTSLTELRISDLLNGSSSLAFIKDMTSLNILVLRNNNITDSIPSTIGEYQSLTELDLSFNNIMGQIPDSLFSLSSLSHLFLGNNQLNGILPAEKSATLLNIDLSYNNLGGSFPSWVSQQNLQLNIVANNFTTKSSNSSALPSGWYCLQQGFPCNQGSRRYYNFGIKCGGPQITSSDGIVYERDNETLGPATYYVTSTNKWAVSNVGYFAGNNNPKYTSSSSSQFINTLDSKLFHTTRLSASSLRYYGLGLKNGNYTVRLQFAEIAIGNSSTWQGLGRRVFDIYIQGNLVAKNFDIRREAGGFSLQAVPKEFHVQVLENYLEIHLFWAGKGTCCIPFQETYGPSISAINATLEFSSKKNTTGLIVGVVVGAGGFCFLAFFVAFYIVRRRQLTTNDDEDLLGLDARTLTFSYAELKIATEHFSHANKLGEGGFGPVFKGMLNDERVIAVKQLSIASHQGKNQFINEIATISAVQHRNLVKLYRYCIEGDKRLLVYEFLKNRSLDQALFGKRTLNLNWSTRYEICLGVARGLAYLHEESHPRIVHRDVKASNILLDCDLIPKISDFGLAKLYDDKKTHISTRVAGTIGYLAPEYAMRGQLTEKADVFSFGVVALELVSGRPNADTTQEEEKVYLLEWAWHLHENNSKVDLVDSKLSEFNENEVKRVIGVSLLCTQANPKSRPSMWDVVAMLSGHIPVSPVTSGPAYLTAWKFDDVTSFMTHAASKGTVSGYYDSPSTSIVGDAESSPVNASKPMLSKTTEEVG